jgi:hypothetical protein
MIITKNRANRSLF